MRYLAVFAALCLTSCAGVPIPQDFMTKAADLLNTAQDIQQRMEKGYAALCVDREAAVECVKIREVIDHVYATGLDVLFVKYEDAQKKLEPQP